MIGATALMVSNSTFAGGILTNTNQNATFLHNPARNAAIAIDGVYNNPAGITFLPQGFHLSVSWQAAMQKRLMEVNNNLFLMNTNNQSTSREFVGKTNAPVIPSFQTAYVINDKWKALDEYLLVKYIDGNIKRQNEDGSFKNNGHVKHVPPAPIYGGYSDTYKKAVAKEQKQ